MMEIIEIVTQVRALLQQQGRLSYRIVQRQFALDDAALEDLKFELIDIQEVAIDKDGKMLVWTGESLTAAELPLTLAQSQPPASYTPKHLAERIRAEQVALEARGAVDGERKIITALFADLKGSTALIEGFDPEEARAIIDPALQLMMEAVHRYEGYVAQALGDGIFALFGAPLAHEDHPQRALYAALRMQEEMRRYSDELRLKHGVPLAMRVGINTGEVILRSIRKDDLHTDYVPVGHSTNLAARMEQMATPGSILITEYTKKLTEGFFELKALGAAEIKGMAEPLPVYEVVGVGPLRTRLQVAARRGLTRFVGRHSELEQLQRAFEQAKSGHGQIVGVMGEPGLGKSRLFYEFKLLSPSGCLVLEAYSVSHGKASPYLPLIELLKAYFQIHLRDDERTRREKVGGKVLMLDRRLEDTLLYLFVLLGIEDPLSTLRQMDPRIRRQRTFEALKKLFVRESLNQPLLLLFEDLHWIDTETQGFLDTLSESVASAKILLLTNYRPEYRHAWGQKTYYTQVRLAPLGQAEAAELLSCLVGQDPSVTGVKQLILAKTEGTPFFMEEVVQTLVEEGVLAGGRGHYQLQTTPTTLRISPTVQGVLAARIDRLAPAEKALLQQVAIIGREFSLSLVHHVVPLPAEELYRLLSSLQSKEFLYEQPAFPEVEYLFKHALTQEVAYGTVLQERRKALHQRTAQAIEQLYQDQLAEHYRELAHHYTRSGNTEKAIEYLHRAGQQAVQRSSYSEAITHLTTGLELVSTLPDTPERAQHELGLQLTLAPPLMITQGWVAPAVGAARTRALTLCRQVGEPAQLIGALLGALSFYLNRAEVQRAQELAEQLLPLAQRAPDAALLVDAHLGIGAVLFCVGEMGSARAHFEQAVALHAPGQWRSAIARVGADLGVVSRPELANVLWFLGYPDQARTRSRTGWTLAREMAYPFTTALVGINDWLPQFLHDARSVQQQTEAVIALCTEQGFSALPPWVSVPQGWALAMQGQAEEGIQQMHQGLAALRATGVEAWRPYQLALLAEAYGKAGQEKEGLTMVAEALGTVHKTGERFYEAELYRLKGELTLKPSRVWRRESRVPGTRHPALSTQAEAEAEACFLKAIEIARHQQAKSLELRAVTSLSRLWQQQRKKTEGHSLLSEIYAWFAEGFDTKDLQEAQALLSALAEGA